MPRQRKKAPRTPLTRERIVATALDLVDREGLGALTMRRLGKELDVDPMAIYYHVEDKNALLDALVEAVMSEIDMECVLPETHTERLVIAAEAYRDVLLAHPNALPIVLARSPRTPAALRPVEFMLAEFMDAGLPTDRATVAMNTLAAAVRGFAGMMGGGGDSSQADVDIEALKEIVSAEEFPALARAMMADPRDPAMVFDEGMRAILYGFLPTDN